MRMMLRVMGTGLTVLGAAWAQGQPGREPRSGGPWNNDVLVYRVSPNGEVMQIATFERAGVPTIARMKDRRLVAAHQHFPENNEADFDKVAVRFSPDEGRNWTAPQVIRVEGLPEGMRFPFDPTLVPLPDGRVRLYFTGNMGRTFQRGTPAIHSAISTDGVNYAYEPGVRFAVEGRMVIDCAVVLHHGVFHLYAPANGPQMQPGRPPRNQPADRPREGIGHHATSKDGLKFTRVEDVQIEGRRRWLGNAQSDGKAITFFGTGDPGESGFPVAGRPRGGVWMGVSKDGREFRLVQAPPIAVADPGAVALREGGWIVVGTGPRVRGRPGANKGRSPGPEPPRSPGIVTHVPSAAGGQRGIAVGILPPLRPRYADGAPVVIHVPGGVTTGGTEGRPEYAGLGFVEIRFAFPRGGRGEATSGGDYDYRGPNCTRALADVIRFATGQLADQQGRKLQELLPRMTVLAQNAGLVGSSHGGNACGLVMAAHGEEFPHLAFYASMESPFGEGNVNIELGGRDQGVNPAMPMSAIMSRWPPIIRTS